jgi:hypothetical protein
MVVHFIYGNWRTIFPLINQKLKVKLQTYCSRACLHQEHNGLAAIVEKSNLCTIELIP